MFSSRGEKLLNWANFALNWILVIVFAVGFQRIGKIDGHRQPFSLEDITIQWPYTGPSTIPNYALVLLSVVFPAAVILLWSLVIESKMRAHSTHWSTRALQLNSSWLGLALSVVLCMGFTNVLKVTVGRPRPDLIARCMPGGVSASTTNLVTSSICSATDASRLHDGFRSFPSGHASMAFSGLAYLAFYLAARLHLWNNRGETWKWVLVMTPAVTAALIGATRIMDNRHHSFDVLFGSAYVDGFSNHANVRLGIATSAFSYRQYFPDFTHSNAFPPGGVEEKQHQTFSMPL